MVRLSSKEISLPSCCLAHVSPASSPPRASPMERGVGTSGEQNGAGSAATLVEDVLGLSPERHDQVDDSVVVVTAADCSGLFDDFDANIFENGPPSPPPQVDYDDDAAFWASPTDDVPAFALVEKVGEFWGAIGMDNHLGLFSVKIESNIGVRIFPTQKLTVTISLTNVDRVCRSFASVTLDAAAPTEGVILPLPKPARFGVEILDIVVDDSKPVTIVYLVA